MNDNWSTATIQPLGIVSLQREGKELIRIRDGRNGKVIIDLTGDDGVTASRTMSLWEMLRVGACINQLPLSWTPDE